MKDFLSKLLVLTESEQEYVREFNDKKYIPELLFEDKEMVNRIKFHPMAFVEDKESLNVFSVNFEKNLLLILQISSTTSSPAHRIV